MSTRSDTRIRGELAGNPAVRAKRAVPAAGVARRRERAQSRIERAAELFFGFADPTRLRILEALARSPLCVSELSQICEISQSGVSHQLRNLRDRELVAFQREGNRVVYRLADEHVRVLLAAGLDHASECGGAS